MEWSIFAQRAGYELSSAPDIDVFSELRAAIYTLPLFFLFLECCRLDFATSDDLKKTDGFAASGPRLAK